MALMDMAVIAPFFTALHRLLRPEGRFVFTVQHPCFNSNAVALVTKETNHGGELVATQSVGIGDYLNVPPGKGPGMPGEPNPHYYFHRPLGKLLDALFKAGFVMDGLEEPALAHQFAGDGPQRWSNRGVPPMLTARMRPSSRLSRKT